MKNIIEKFKLITMSMLIVGGIAASASSFAENADKNTNQAANEQSTTAGETIDDSAITAKVKAAIFAEPDLKSLQISVETVKGVVKLTGAVDSFTASNKARTVAAAVSGVKDVDNQLVVKR